MNNSLDVANMSREELLAKRYGVDASDLADAKAPWNVVLSTLVNRYSTRAFTDAGVTEQQLAAIVAAAQSAPTSSNLQSWSVIAVQDPSLKAKLAVLSGNQRHIIQAPLLLVFVADLARLRTLGKQAASAVEGLEYFDSFLVSVVDSSLAAQNAAVAATSMGLGSCFIGAMRNNPAEVAKELGLPEESFAVFGLAVGTPDRDYDSDIKPRLPASIVLHREKYGTFDPVAMKRYDAAMTNFELSQNMPASTWTSKAIQRVSGAAALTGREKLLRVLKERGFVMK
ncbi:nitroreductase family protein [Roseateles noduli]|uniref:nitroreductase family protein n=1 Tax=Roseateles noduli TaxID=2052484 RepID=UPI003D64A1BF